jgi:uncharacterized repeat protein (TIGR02543 family)
MRYYSTHNGTGDNRYKFYGQRDFTIIESVFQWCTAPNHLPKTKINGGKCMKKSIGIILLLVVVAVGFGKDLLAEKTISRIDKPMITEINRDFEAQPFPADWKNPIHREPTDVMSPWITYTRWDSMYYYLTGLPTHYGMMYKTYDFGLDGAITFDSIEAYWASYDLYTDSMIKFQIYGEDGSSLLWESPSIKVESTDFYLGYDIDPDFVADPGEVFYVVVQAASYANGGPQIVTEAQPTSIAPRRRTCVSGTPGAWNVSSWSYCISVKATSASAPTYDLSESFDGATFPPTGWSANILTGTYNWAQAWTGSHYRFINVYLDGDRTGLTPTPAPGMAFYESYNANPDDDARLVSPAVATSTVDWERVFVKFNMFQDAQYSAPDSLVIETSTDGGTTWVPKATIMRYISSSGWYEQNIDCGIFPPSSNVLIGFHAVGQWGNNIYIDYIRSWREYVNANDVGVTDITIPSYNPIWVGETRAITVDIKNYGTATQTAFNVCFDPGDGSAVVSEPWTGSLAMGASTPYTFTALWNCNTAGPLYTFKAWTELATDEDMSNDTADFLVAVCPLVHIPPYYKDFDEPWGTYGDNPPYCGWTIIAGGDEPTPTWNANDWMHWSGGAWIQYSPQENQNDWLYSPKFDCSAPGFYELGFYSDFASWAVFDTGEVFYTVDDGLTWNLIVGYYGDGVTGPLYLGGNESFDMSTVISGQSSVKFAFNYRAYDSYYWLIDDFYLDYLTPQTLTITATNGSVTKNPDLALYPYGSTVELTAVPDSGYAFVGWSGDLTGMTNPENILMDGDKSVTANFALIGWNVSVPMPGLVKDGGAIVAVTPPTDDGGAIYGFRGWKTADFYKFDGAAWTAMTPIPVGLKYKPTKPIDSLKFNKKGPGKGASLCWDGDNTIYTIKGNGLWEFWAYDITANTWTAKQWIGGDKGAKAGSAIAYADGKVYMLLSKQKLTGFFYVYDVGTDAWTELTSPPLGPNTKKWKDGTDLLAFGEGKLLALKGGDKYNAFFEYDIAGDTVGGSPWLELESIPLAYPTTMVEKPKKVKVKDGGSLTTDGSEVYAIKGGGKQDFWKYTPGTPGVWTALEMVPQGPLLKKGCPKTGAGLAYLNGYVYLLKGNKTDEFWYYLPGSSAPMSAEPRTIANVSGDVKTTLVFNLSANSFSKTINYTVPAAGKVSLKLYNAAGRLVETIHNGYAHAGNYTTTLSNVSSGVYFLKYNDGTNSAEVKVIVQ